MPLQTLQTLKQKNIVFVDCDFAQGFLYDFFSCWGLYKVSLYGWFLLHFLKIHRGRRGESFRHIVREGSFRGEGGSFRGREDRPNYT